MKDVPYSGPSRGDDGGSETSEGHEDPFAPNEAFLEFVGKPFTLDMNEAGINTWLLYRQVFPVSYGLLPPDVEFSQREEFQAMFDIYDKYAAPVRIESWRTLDDVSRAYDVTAREELFRRLDAMDNKDSIPYLEPDLVPIIGDHIDQFFAVLSAFRQRGGQGYDVTNAEIDHPWAMMLNQFFVTPQELVSRRIMSGFPLRLCDNTHLQALKSPGNISAAVDLLAHAEEWKGQITSIRDAAALSEPAHVMLQHDHGVTLAEIMVTHLQEETHHLEEHTSLVEEHAAEEPTRGNCDRVLYARVSLEGADVDNAMLAAAKEAHKDFRLSIINPLNKRKKKQPVSPDWLFKNRSDEESTSKAGKRTMSAEDIEDLVFTTSIVVIPQIVMQRQRIEDDSGKVMNEARMYCVSAVRFLNAMGIKGQPVFGVATFGTVGGIIMGWMSSTGVIYLLERNAQVYNLEDVLEAFHFTTFLIRVRAREAVLKAAFEERKADLIKALAEGTYERWSMEDPPRGKTQSEPL
ncbi:hypothetical protein BDW22DRAFT_1355660 [Trametopsis cervina]|nr:hypothetical protein BDW22DRAFT_1355660 [Trametopsis cervina]